MLGNTKQDNMKSRQAAGDGRSHEKEKAWPIKWAVILTPGEEAWPKKRTDLTTFRELGSSV